jgi:protein arginine N-methyltransferase 1
VANQPTGYNVLSYGQMVSSEPRTPAYVEALRRAVRPGSTVIDIGAGPGPFSILACTFGAGKVVAIDPHESIELVDEIARANGCADRIEVFKGLSTDYSPSVKADVIVSDLRGILPLFEAHIASIADARKRLLAPGGVLIPARDVLKIALARSPEHLGSFDEPWLRNRIGLDLSAGHRFAVNEYFKVNLTPADLLCGGQTLAVLDYYSISDPDFVADFELTVEEGGTAHGLVLWFDAELLDDVGFSNAPGEPRQVYGQTFFVLEHAVELEPGDRVVGQMGARLIDGSYTWTWRTDFHRTGSAEAIKYRQSSFLANVMALNKLRTRADNFAPPRRLVHEIDRFCLGLFDGERTLEAIAEEVRAQFPQAFPDGPGAFDHVTRLAGRYEDNGR